MLYKDFEIRPTCYLDGHTDPNRFDVVKWYTHEPWEVTDLKTGEKKISTRSCYSVAHIWWNEKESGWEFKSVWTRFLEEYVEGLNEFILQWMALMDVLREKGRGMTMNKSNDAEKLIEMLNESALESYMNPLAQYDRLKDELRRAKALTYEDLVPHGRWQSCEEDGVVVCSVCGNVETQTSYFCRCCGTKMDEGKDNESN